jgi:glyoxylate reductase
MSASGSSSPQRARVVVAQPLPAAGLDPLRERFDVVVGDPRPAPEELRRLVIGAVALVADPTVHVDAELLDAAGPQLRIVANFAVGYDNIDLEACRARGVIVTNTPDVLTNATAELAVALMLAAARHLGEAERLLRRGGWTGWEPEQLLGRELADSTVGIVGLGRIGSRVAELLQGFGSTLLYSSRRARPELEARLGLKRRDLDDLLAEADIVTLHVALNEVTHHLIDSRALEHFKPGAILVNTARGGLVDTDALISALQSGRLAAAALDVYENEPEVPAALVALENVVLAPHIGSATDRARNGMARLVADNVIAVLEGRGPVTPVT